MERACRACTEASESRTGEDEDDAWQEFLFSQYCASTRRDGAVLDKDVANRRHLDALDMNVLFCVHPLLCLFKSRAGSMALLTIWLYLLKETVMSTLGFHITDQVSATALHLTAVDFRGSPLH
eukprot:77166-Rhodomonas_salina.1